MKGDDKAQIEAKTEGAGSRPRSRCTPRLPPANRAAPSGAAAAGQANDDVVDAEFTEVKDDQK